MQTLKLKLIAAALGAAALGTPFAIAHTTPGNPADAGTDAATASNASAPASTVAQPQGTDAVSEKTTAQEGKAMGASTTTAQSAKVAGTAAPGQGDWWKNADTNGDGKISATEATVNAGLSSRFSNIDINKDGYVTMEEYRAFYTSNASQGEQNAAAHSAVVSSDLWLKLDTDADSRVSMAEAQSNAELAASFAAMDSNGDGFLTQAEYTAYSKPKQ